MVLPQGVATSNSSKDLEPWEAVLIMTIHQERHPAWRTVTKHLTNNTYI